ncbi:hypothetical protein BAE44_0017927 [Dichanthelium oligosanthes]|uniref:Uncharacterized protein n=1 Tax=Dichanthelium oligosanthes TaxID=888268 RepID=A0A1E5V7P8_9POAL|nr:hypothetical protein BAE44_0017927 [Dichanthelium oligosanthes]
METQGPLQEATEQVAGQLCEHLSEQPLGVCLPDSCCHLGPCHPPADRLHHCAVLHQEGLARTLWLDIYWCACEPPLCLPLLLIAICIGTKLYDCCKFRLSIICGPLHMFAKL